MERVGLNVDVPGMSTYPACSWPSRRTSPSLTNLPHGPVHVAGDNDENAPRRNDPDRAKVVLRSHRMMQRLMCLGGDGVPGPTHATVDGDEAVAVCESLLVRRREDGYSVRRAGANYFLIRRLPEGWRVVHRTTRALDGSEEARGRLADGALGRRA